MADDIRSRAGLDPREEAARRRRDGEARRAAAREALTQEQMRERTMKEMEARRAAPPARSGPNRIPPSPRPSSVTPIENRPPGRIPEPPRPSTVGTMRGAAAPAMRAGSRLIPGVGAVAGMAPTSMEAGAKFEREGMQQARMEQARMRDRAGMEQERGEAGQRRPTARPRPRPARRAAREEISANDLNDMVLEQLRGRRSQPSTMPMAQARDNIELAMGRDTQPEIGSVQREDFRRGGMIAAKPKKAAPKKPMPFKKGGAIKMKGKK